MAILDSAADPVATGSTTLSDNWLLNQDLRKVSDTLKILQRWVCCRLL
jgi:hypothetical protein